MGVFEFGKFGLFDECDWGLIEGNLIPYHNPELGGKISEVYVEV